jgi:nucleotide-binding universal stress UspA family protein
MIPKTIVVPLDGSVFAQRALSVAAPLAGRLGADLLLMGAPVDESPDTVRSYLETVAAFAADVPIDVCVVPDGTPKDAISRVADDGPDRMVCMTTHGRGRFRWAALGSVAEEVVRSSTRPLLLVGPHSILPSPAERSGQVVLCVDGSSAAQAAVGPACEWARALDCELTLTYVAYPLDVQDALHPDEFVAPLEEPLRAEGIPFHTRLVRGYYPAGALLDVVSDPPATLAVMAAHGRKGLARMALGSVTMGVVNSAPCPILVVPPDLGGASETAHQRTSMRRRGSNEDPRVTEAVPTPPPV